MRRLQTILRIIPLLWVTAGSVYTEALADTAEESMNPLSTVISVPFENNTLFNIGPSESTSNVLNVKPIFPVSMGDWNLINRVGDTVWRRCGLSDETGRAAGCDRRRGIRLRRKT